MKILIVVNSLKTGGAEKLIVDFVNALSKYDNYELKLLVLSSRHAVHYDRISEHEQLQVEFLGKNEYNPWLIFKIRTKLKEYDVVHVHLFPALYFVGIASFLSFDKRSRLFFTEHNNQNKRLGKPYLRGFEKWIYKRYHCVIAITDLVNKKIKGWANHSNIVTIPNGLPIGMIGTAPIYNRTELLKSLDFPLDTKLILMSARFELPKRQDLLVRTIGYLPENYRVLLAGIGPGEAHVKEKANELCLRDRVKFLGFRKDIYSLMKSVDINVLWSDYEGMSGVTLEALASGKPFLGSNAVGISDVVPSDAFLFDDMDGLIAKIRMLCEDVEQSRDYGRVGLNHIKQYDMGVMVDRHAALYKSIFTDTVDHG